jgi:hypothetical protein
MADLTLLFPRRRRCLSCHAGLGVGGAPVYDGLYCSPHCAHVPVPPRQVADLPRECRAFHDGRWTPKRRYRCLEEIPRAISCDPSVETYRCSCCHHLHIGHSRLHSDERFRMFSDIGTDLGDLLVKLRGRATRKQVGAAAGIRPIRIAELERGVTGPHTWENLSRLLRVYHVRLGAGLPVADARTGDVPSPRRAS